MAEVTFKISLDRCKKKGFYNEGSSFGDLEEKLKQVFPFSLSLAEFKTQKQKNIDSHRNQIHRNKDYEKTSINIKFEVPEEIIGRYGLRNSRNKEGRRKFQEQYIFNQNINPGHNEEKKMQQKETYDPKEDQGFEKNVNYQENGQIEFITFHPAYSYEEFIEGITVETGKEEQATESLKYKLKPGIFKNLCKKALGVAIGMDKESIEKNSWEDVFNAYSEKGSADFEKAPKYVLIIDEINRGDMAKIFGELITLLEADKRLSAENELIATLPCSNDKFGIPPNLYIIGTMNTADRSIALIDVALRRRFGFIEMNPDFEVLKSKHIEPNKDDFEEGLYELLLASVDAIKSINQTLCGIPTIGRDKQIGHSFLFKVKNVNDLKLVWKHEILPLLEEYCYGEYRKINEILFGESASPWINEMEGIKEIEDLNSFIQNIRNE